MSGASRGWAKAGALVLAPLAAVALAASPAPSGAPRWLVLIVRQPITVATREYLAAGLARAKATGADGVLVELDTPGGSLQATHGIVESFLGSSVPVVVYVSPEGAHAGSAGLFITLAANLAAMAPASTIGAAHPISSTGKDVAAEGGNDLAKKVENDTAAFARTIAKERGRNEDWAEKAVRESVSATSEDALKLHVIDRIAKSAADLLAAVDGETVETAGGKVTLRGKDARLVPFRMSIRQKLLSLLSDPNLAALLMLLGMAGIGLEFYHPGSIYPGLVGGVLLVLGLLATEVIPVNLGAIVLLLAGGVLLVTESYLPLHGAAGILGAICLLLGSLLFVNKGSPDYQFSPGAWTVSPFLVWPAPIAVALILLFVGAKVAQSRGRPLVAGAAGLIGERGQALSDIDARSGQAFLHGEYWQARAEEKVARGAAVRVIGVDGLVVRVIVVEEPRAG